MRPRLSRGDYVDWIVKQDTRREEAAAELRTAPRVVVDGTGWIVNLYAFHPDGANAPRLPDPWRWYNHMNAWYCQVAKTEAPNLERIAKQLFGLE